MFEHEKELDEWVKKILKAIAIEKMSLTEKQLHTLRDTVWDCIRYRLPEYPYVS